MTELQQNNQYVPEVAIQPEGSLHFNYPELAMVCAFNNHLPWLSIPVPAL